MKPLNRTGPARIHLGISLVLAWMAGAAAIGVYAAGPVVAVTPKPPYRAWFQPAWDVEKPDLYAHANLITSLGSGHVKEAAFWNRRGVAALHWAYGPNSPYGKGPAYFRDQCNPESRNYRWAGVGVDEWNVHGKNAARNRKWCAEGLRMARRKWPDLFIEVWVTRPDAIFAGLLRDGTINLAIIEGYTLIPNHPEWEIDWQGIAKRCQFLRRAGVLNKTIVCFGYVTAQPDKDGKRLTRSGLKKLVTEAHRKFPEMPGVAFYGWSGNKSAATLSLIRFADQLSAQF